jgi:hypothetical protein
MCTSWIKHSSSSSNSLFFLFFSFPLIFLNN